jgi:ribonuclease-3
MGDNTASLEARLGYKFQQRALLREALTHPSIAHNKQRVKKGAQPDNEPDKDARTGFHFQRLEHLGDAVVQLAVSEALFEQFPREAEGLLTKLRTRAVQTGTMARLARELELGKHLILGRGEDSSGGRDRDKILADALEAIIGAVHQDAGYEKSRPLVLRLWAAELAALLAAPVEQNPKGQLQELLQNHGGETPAYRIVATEGPSHARTFEVAVVWAGRELAHGSGRSKQEAEISAAQKALVHPTLNEWIAENAASQSCEQPCEDHSNNSTTVRTGEFHI